MHVVMTTDAVGGVWSYSLTLTAALRRRGIDVTLVSIGPAPDAMQTAMVPPGTRLHVTDYKLEWQEGLNGDVALSGAFIARLVDDLRPEVLHSNHYCYGALATGTAKVVVAHNDLLSWLTWTRNDGDAGRLVVPPHLTDYRAFVEEGLAGADVVVCPSSFMAASLTEHYRTRPRTIVIPNGIEMPPDAYQPRQASGSLTAVIAGRLWDEAKGVDVAIAGTHQASAPVRLLAIGPTLSPDGFERPIAADERITPLGLLPQADVPRAYQQADVYLASSRYEPFGLAPLEAALTGCAVICNDLPSYREVWGDVALYYRRNDPADLAGCLDKLARDPEHLDELRVRARERALSYTAEIMVDRYVALYRGLIDRSLPRAMSVAERGATETSV